MKKILVINNDYHVPQSALDFAIQIAKKEKATLYGLFVQSLQNKDAEDYLFPSDINLTDTDFTKATDKQENLQFEETNIQLFSDICSSSGVPYKTHPIHAAFLDTLIDHSAFADLIVCDADTSPSQYSIKTLVANAHCPVLLVNKDYKQIDNIIFTYDDKSSSIHAIKYFTYLFKFYSNLPVHFVSVVPHNVIGIEYADLIKEWLPLHYANAQIVILNGETKEELSGYINNHSNPLVIMGAFGRSSLSRFFKESLAYLILEKTNAPLFITHN